MADEVRKHSERVCEGGCKRLKFCKCHISSAPYGGRGGKLVGWHEKLLVRSPDHPSGSVGPGAPSHPEGRREVERNKKKMKGEWGANTDEASISDPGMLWSDDGIYRKNPPLMRQIGGDIL